MRFFSPLRLWLASATLAGLHLVITPKDFSFALLVWVAYAAGFTVYRTWRSRWWGVVQPTLAYAALAYLVGPDFTSALIGFCGCNLGVALLVDLPRLIASVAQLCARLWRAYRARKAANLRPVAVVARPIGAAVDATDVLRRFGLVKD